MMKSEGNRPAVKPLLERPVKTNVLSVWKDGTKNASKIILEGRKVTACRVIKHWIAAVP